MNYSILVLSSLLSFLPTIVHAQTIIPNQDSTGTIVHQQGNQFNIQGGSRSGNNTNLFHSFQEFNVNQGQTANFISTPTIKNILGRINGGNPSIINGLIEVTGGNSNLFLMNPAGIIFGANASLNLPASFHVSTATGIGFDNNQWFQSVGNNDYANLVSTPNKFIFANTQPGTIINQGKLHLNTGKSLSFLGGSVINTGELSAPGGNITIAAVKGENIVKISQVGHLLSLELLPFANTNQSPQIDPVALPQLLTGSVSDNQANTIKINEFGQIVLGNTGFGINDINQTAINAGKIDISSAHNGSGGQVSIIGNKVGLIGGEINASGYNQGGTVLIGGDFQGQGIVPNAWQTYVSQDSIINADAINNGNGGKVIIWSDNRTNFQGSITARGGVNSGNGGLVEISGKKELIFNGKVDVSAVNGLPGIVLFDPDNLTLEKSDSQDDSLTDSDSKTTNDKDGQSEATNVTKSEQKETKTVDKTDSSESNVSLIDEGETENVDPVVKVANKKDAEATKQTASADQTKTSDKPTTAKLTTGNKSQTSTKKPITAVKTPTSPTKKANKDTTQAKTSPDKTVNDQEKLSVETRVIDPFAPDKSNNVVINSENINKLDINKLDVAGNIELKVNNDLTVNQAIATDKSLKLVAGRSININADIDTSKGNGNIGIFANDTGVDKTKRQTGPANILQAENTVLNAGAGDIVVEMGSLGEVGEIKLGDLRTEGLIAIEGAGANINQVSANSLFKANKISLENSDSSGIGNQSSPLRIEAKNLEAISGSKGIFLNALSNITIGGVSDQITGIQATDGGKINLKTNGNLKVNENISTYVDGDINAGDITITSTGNIDSSLAKINAGSFNGDAGDISVETQGSIITGDITSISGQFTYNDYGDVSYSSGSGSGNSGNISLNSKIYTDTSKGQVLSQSVFGNAGNITIESQGDIRTANVKSIAGTISPNIFDEQLVGEGLSGNITIKSQQGLIENIASVIESSSNNKNSYPLISLTANDDLKIGGINNIFGQTSLTANNIISTFAAGYSIDSKNLNVSASNDIKLNLVYIGNGNITSSNGNIQFENIESKNNYSKSGGITLSSERNIMGTHLYSNNGKISVTSGESIKIDEILSFVNSLDNKPSSYDIVVNAKKDITVKEINTDNYFDGSSNVIETPNEWLSGNITLNSADGGITVENSLRTNGVIKSGDINLTAKGDINVNGNISATLADISAFPEIDITSLKSTAGNVSLTSQNGGIYLQDINTAMYSAGQVNINAYGEIFTGNINTQGTQQGGDVNLISETASINTTLGQIEATALSKTGINGKINIQSASDISVGTINSSKNLNIIEGGNDNFNIKNPQANIKTDADKLKQKSGKVILEAHNDINLAEAIESSNISYLELKAGRNINIKANIDTSGGNGDIVLKGNIKTSQPDLRETGAGSITMASGTKLNAGNGNISLALGDAGQLGNIVVGNLQTTGLVTIDGKGANILANDQNSMITSGNLLLQTLGDGGIGTKKLPLSVKVDNLEASSGGKGLFLNSLTPVNIGNVSDQALGIKTVGGGEVNINVAGNLTISEPINTSSLDTNGGNIFLNSQGNIKFDPMSGLDPTILDSSSNYGNGGDIQVKATGNITSVINSSYLETDADASSRANNSKTKAGDIIFQAGGNIVVNGLSTSDTMMNSMSMTGDISVTSTNGSITFTGLTTSGYLLNSTGNIKVKAKKNIQGEFIRTDGGGTTSDISLTSELGKIDISRIFAMSNVFLPAGNVDIKAGQDITIEIINYPPREWDVLSQTGGNINVTSDQGNIYLYDAVSVGTLAGDINLTAKGNILFHNLDASGKQQGGNIQLISQQGEIRQFINFYDYFSSTIVNGLLTGSTDGRGGNILVDGNRGINLEYADGSGKIAGGDITLFSQQGDIKIFSTNTQSTTNNQAGLLSMESVNGNIITGAIEANNLTINQTDSFLTESGLVSLKAHNDITIAKPIITTKITDLEIKAGRNLNINADINTSASNGNITLQANFANVNPKLRGKGPANITMANGTTLKAGKGNIRIEFGDFGLDNPNKYIGNIVLNNIMTDGNLVINSQTGNILRQSPNSLVEANKVKLSGSQIGLAEAPLRLNSNTLQALAKKSLYIDAPQSGINLDHNVNDFEEANIMYGDFYALSGSEEIRVTAQGDIKSFGAIAESLKIHLESRKGQIDTSQGQFLGKNITLKSPKNIYVGNIGDIYSDNTLLTIKSTGGEIDTTAGNISSANLILEAFGNIRTGFIKGNNIQITSKQGSINTTVGQLEYDNELQINPLEDINNVVLNLNVALNLNSEGIVGIVNILGLDYSGNVSNINLEAKDDVTTNSITSSAPNNSSNIKITSHTGNINTDAIISVAESGRSGNITLNAPQGNINTNHLYTFTNQQSGNININAGGTFNTGGATINTGGIAFQGIGGNVSIKTGGDVLIGGDIHRYGIRTEGREGGGNINIESDGKINITGDLNSYSERNRAGHIMLDGATGVTTSNILSDGPLESGNVNIRSASGSILTNNIKTIAPNGVSGNINLNTIKRQGNIESANISTIGQNLAGEIKIRANDGSIKTENLTSSANNGTAGGIDIEGNDINTGDQTVNSSKGSGTIKNKAKNNINTGDLIVSAEDYALIKQLAGDSIATGNIKVESKSGDASNQQQAGQNIQTGNISVIAGNNAENIQKAGGNIQTGNISITGGNNATNNQKAVGNINTGDINITAGNDGINQQKAGGNINTGDINITAGNNAINDMKAGGRIDTGAINLNAPNVQNSIKGEKGVSTETINGILPLKSNLPVANSSQPNNLNPIPNIPNSPIVLPANVNTESLTNQKLILQTPGISNQVTIPIDQIQQPNNPNNSGSQILPQKTILPNSINLPSVDKVTNPINYQQNSPVNPTIFSDKPNLSDQPINQLDSTILNIHNSLNIASNSQLLTDIETSRNQEFSNYWGESFTDETIDQEGIKNILGNIKQQTGINSAVIYINSYPESIQIVSYTATGQPIFKTIPVSQKELLKVAQDFRANITNPRERNSKKYLIQAQQLYQWLIKPIEDTLQTNQIDTLLFSLDEGLRSLPMVALHDGQHFLVEKYSSSIIPSISLMNTRYDGSKQKYLLAMGVSEFTNLPKLPGVPMELNMITTQYQISRAFLNKEAIRDNLIMKNLDSPYQIIHLATHAEFLPGNPSNSYIQLWDSKLQLSQIRELGWNKSDVELLVLSACRTAVGDAQAELGFAGLAIGTGVKSVLGSLWYVSDYGTLGLMTEFYDHLREVKIKAEALRQAQLTMLRGEVNITGGQLFNSHNRSVILPVELTTSETIDFSHPYYWSGFTMVGSPW